VQSTLRLGLTEISTMSESVSSRPDPQPDHIGPLPEWLDKTL
jgi:hypothetical protein